MDYSPIWISLEVACVSTLLALPPAFLLALWLVRSQSPLKPLIDALVNVPLVLPPLCTGYLLLVVFGTNGPLAKPLQFLGWHIPFTRAAAVLAAAAISFPLTVRALQVALDSVDHRLEEAARALGLGELHVIYSVTLPLSLKGVAAAAILTFSKSLGEFGATIIFAGNISGHTRTIPLALFHYFSMPDSEYQVRFLMVVAIALSFAATFGVAWLMRKGVRNLG